MFIATQKIMSDDRFDLLVIGAGSGGSAAAQKAASMGFKVAIAEKSCRRYLFESRLHSQEADGLWCRFCS